ncbi:MAG: hypothetical protein ACJ712_01860, partial [Nitrososphaeraceae archaeon]
MSSTSSIFALFSVLVGILLFGIWSNTHVFAQQLPLSSPPAAGSSNSLSTPTISAELKSKICDPSNPSLKVVNTTEARICGIPKTVKPPIASAATPQTTPVVSSSPSSPTQQTVTTKPITAAAPHSKQQQVTTSNNNTNAISRPTGGASGAIVSPFNHPTSKPQAGIAPQVKAVNQQPLPSISGINTTAPQVKAV